MNGGGNDSYMDFYTRNNDTLYQRVRIDDTGNVGIGTTTIPDLLDVNGAIGITTTTSTLPLNGLYSSTTMLHPARNTRPGLQSVPHRRKPNGK